MKYIKFTVIAVLLCYIAAVGFNIAAISNVDEKALEGNKVIIALEVASRLGFAQTMELIGGLFSTNEMTVNPQNEKYLKEFVNILFDWYAPIKWPPVLGISKEIGWLLLKDKFDSLIF